MSELQLHVLGPLRVWHDGRSVPIGAVKQRTVLALLALQAGRTVPANELVAALWGDDPPATATRTLQSLVSRLRAALPGTTPVVSRRPPGYQLEIPPEQVDAHQFARLVGEAADQPVAQAAATLRRALDLWYGLPLADLERTPVVEVEAVRLAEHHDTAQGDYLDAELRLGRHRQVLSQLHALTATAPLRERTWRQLMLALYRSDRQADALAAYQRARDVLTTELGIEPGPELQELHQRILAADPTLTPPAPDPSRTPSDSPSVPRQLPADPAAAFAGRVAELAQLDSLLATPPGAHPVPLSAIGGMAGMGKTALVVHWAHRVAGRFPDGQLYIDLRGYDAERPLAPVEVLAGFLHALGLRGSDIPVVVDRAVAAYRSLLASRRVLVVLDNAASAEQVRPLLPAGAGCLALVTSRDGLGGLVARDGARYLNLDVLAPAEAHMLLVQTLGADRVRAEPEAAAELARLCGHLPLALRVVAANLAVRPRQRIADQVARLRESGRLDVLAVDGDPGNAVAAAFGLSYTRLPEPARRLFRLLGLVPGRDVTVPAAAALAGQAAEQVARTLDTLARVHLVEEHSAGRYACHDLLRRYAADRAAEEATAPERAAAQQRLFDWYQRTAHAAVAIRYPQTLHLPGTGAVAVGALPVPFDGRAEAQAWLADERDNLVRTTMYAAEHGPWSVAWRLSFYLGSFWWSSGRLVDGRIVATAALAAATRESDLVGQAAAHLTLGGLSMSLGDYPPALERLEDAAELAGRAGWTDGRAAALGASAYAHARQGGLEQAAARLTEARTLDHGRPDRLAALATTANTLGGVYQDLGRLAQAAECFTESVAAYRQLGAPGSGYAIPLCNLGGAARDLGWLDQAHKHVDEALALSREERHRLGEVAALSTLATVHCEAGRYTEALDTAQAAARQAGEIGYQNAVVTVGNTLGMIHRGLGRPQQALDHHRQALAQARQVGERAQELDARLGLAAAHRDLGEHDRAQEYARQVLESARALGYRLREGQALTTLAKIHLGRHELDRAGRYAERALTNHRQTGHQLGEARTRLLLGHIRSQVGDTGAAHRHWRQAHAQFVDIGAPEAAQAAALLPDG